jgi:hypothetical protein
MSSLFAIPRGERQTQRSQRGSIVFRRTDLEEPALAAGGGVKWTTTFGALTYYALGLDVGSGGEAAPTMLTGSSIVSTGGGSSHRTLAAFPMGRRPVLRAG